MPIYRYRCECGKVVDEYRRINDRDRVPECHGAMSRVLTPAMVSVFHGYTPVAANKEDGSIVPIRNKKEHEAFLRRNGYEEIGNDLKPPSGEELAQRRQAWQDAPDAPMVDVEKLQKEGFISEDLTV